MKAFHARRLVGIVVLASGLCGCGASLSYTVDEDVLQRLPKKSRRSVFQARTVVTIAIDKRASVKRQLDGNKRELERLEQRRQQIERELSKASEKQKARLEAELDMLDAKERYLEAKGEFLARSLEVADKEVMLARAQFELAKLRLVKKHSIAFDGDEQDFVEQVEDWKQTVEEERRDLQQLEAELKLEEKKWLEAKRKFYSSVGESSKGWWTE